MRKGVLLGIVGVLLLCLVSPCLAVAAQDGDGWYYKPWAPDRVFTHFWNGTLLRTENGLEWWELYSEIRMMGTTSLPAGGGDFEWVKMTIMWDPMARMGQIIKFEHFGMNLRFMGWMGNIGYDGLNTDNYVDGVYHFQVSGRGVGLYRSDSKWLNLYIWGSFGGLYFPDNSEIPLMSGRTEATEHALLKYGFAPVGGEIVPVSRVVLIAPLLVVSLSALTIGFTISRKRRLSG